VASDDSAPDDDDDSVADILPEDPPQAETDLLPDDPSENLGPDPPTVPDTSQNDADPELKRRFWSLVFVFNVALFGMSLGLMLVGFEGRWQFGGSLFLVGAFAFLRGWHRYRKVQREIDAETAESDTEDTERAESGEEEPESDGGESEPDDRETEADDERPEADDEASDPEETTDSELQKD
jgi:hypothetical protein